ncbi:RxLR-like protein [Plasmopara halstedii]|uniref:RxLR-like protein n=1 Tax=Plasmopara halstedii TaxID=4781 RepID=A0A0P1AXC8_PLAHL|nr:RxLR-like protein [Plasmopara halstedii]CEG46700.1 RxLR-like protein [Plasmopara halstedii]|eukprot:XP_024583069.1 RxLR-like protein [Plasmopara halstedii]
MVSHVQLLSLMALLALLQSSSTSAKRLDLVSFEKPFDDVDAGGLRQLGENFVYGGDAAVNRHFARLTPDRQSKRGFIWGKQKLAVKEFTAVLTFRISGQAKSWFGDGLALWLTTSEYMPGDNHGFIGEYKGIGILFDTFVNKEHSGGHKDVTFFENDGTKTLDQLNDMEKQGCMAPGIRYHEKNAAFNPSLNMSRAKITYTQADQHITILVDADASGNWIKCYSQRLNFGDDWMSDAYVGISASTGSLADNHDVISIKVYDDVIDSLVDQEDEKHRNAKDKTLEAKLSEGSIDDRMKVVKQKYTHLIEEFEYKITSLKESTDTTIQRLKQQEIEDEKRIEELEAWANGKVRERVHSTENAIRDQVNLQLEATVKETAAKSSGWKTPFFIVVIIIAGIVAVGYQKYQALRKTHFL